MKTHTTKIKWGIIGLGSIAHSFVQDLLLVPDAELYAVASRDLNRSEDFGNQYGATKRYGSYQELMNDKEVTIVYIATPHDSHAILSVQALDAGKHVLCEKPIAINYKEAMDMITASQRNHKFLMEAFWTRFNPSVQQALSKIQQGALGEIRYINADFAFHIPNPDGRMVNITNGGGSLLDMGVYPLFLSYIVLGKPEKIVALANFFDTGADQQTSIILQYKNAHAVLHSSFMARSNMTATISGTEGRINLHSIWHQTQGYSLLKDNNAVDYPFPTNGKGFTYEIKECHHCIRNNQTQSSIWSHQNSLDLIQIADEVRKQAGITYPADNT